MDRIGLDTDMANVHMMCGHCHVSAAMAASPGGGVRLPDSWCTVFDGLHQRFFCSDACAEEFRTTLSTKPTMGAAGEKAQRL